MATDDPAPKKLGLAGAGMASKQASTVTATRKASPLATARPATPPQAASADTGRSSSSGLAILLGMLFLILGTVGGAGYLVWKQYGGDLASLPYVSDWFGPKPYSGPPKPGAVAFTRSLLDSIGEENGSASYATANPDLRPTANPAPRQAAIPRTAAPAPTAAASSAVRTDRTVAASDTPISVRPTNEISAADRDRMQTVSRWLQGIHVGAVKATGSHRVMIGSQSYDVGDTVNPELGLQFAGVEDGKLMFRDVNDFLYMKRF